MTHETEAECLLRTGRLYPRRVGLKSPAGTLVFTGVKHGAFSLYFDDEPIYHLDLEGRWQRAYVTGTHYRKALDGATVAIDREREGGQLVLRRRPLDLIETMDLDARVRQEALDLLGALRGGRLSLVPPPAGSLGLSESELLDLLGRVTRWDANAWLQQRERYAAVYSSPLFLPPDAHQAVILQPIAGKALAEFEPHARAVARLLGRRLAQCRSVFLAGGHVLRRPIDELASLFETTARVFPIRGEAQPARRSELDVEAVQLRGIDAFLSDFAPPLPDRAGWERLKALHLGRVNLGVIETDPGLWPAVAALKAAGVPLGLVVGDRADLEATADLLRTLALDREDIVYLMDRDDAAVAGFRGRLAPAGAKVVPYSLAKQRG